MKEKEDSTISTLAKEERREFFRVDETLPLNYELVSQEALYEEEKSPIIPKLSLSNEDVNIKDIDPGLLKFLKSIESKLNLILRHLLPKDYVANIPPLKEINISAAGARFRCKERFKKGDILKVTFGFPPYPYRFISILSEIVRIEEEVEGGLTYYNTAVKFLDLAEDLREDIIRHLLETQRKAIKEKRTTEI